MKKGLATATTGLLAGIVFIAAVAVLLGRWNIFSRIPVRYLDLIAGVLVLFYGLYFAQEAFNRA